MPAQHSDSDPGFEPSHDSLVVTWDNSPSVSDVTSVYGKLIGE
jgi:hypothetical protein